MECYSCYYFDENKIRVRWLSCTVVIFKKIICFKWSCIYDISVIIQKAHVLAIKSIILTIRGWGSQFRRDFKPMWAIHIIDFEVLHLKVVFTCFEWVKWIFQILCTIKVVLCFYIHISNYIKLMLCQPKCICIFDGDKPW